MQLKCIFEVQGISALLVGFEPVKPFLAGLNVSILCNNSAINKVPFMGMIIQSCSCVYYFVCGAKMVLSFTIPTHTEI